MQTLSETMRVGFRSAAIAASAVSAITDAAMKMRDAARVAGLLHGLAVTRRIPPPN